jgi:nucleotide-binding universal stress UspA family protein
MFKRILVPLDGSARAEQALPIAARIARASGGSVLLLHVITAPLQFEPYLFGPYMLQSTLLPEAVSAAITGTDAYLSKAARSHDLAGAETKVAMFSGAVALTILDTAKEQYVDLILMASHGHTGFKRWALGSIAQKVARSSPVPVLVLREGGSVPSSAYPDRTRPLHAIAATVALDGSPLAEAAIFPAANLVAALAAPAKGSLHLTRIVQLPKGDDGWGGRRRMDLEEQAIDGAACYLRKIAGDLHDSLEREFNLSITWSVAGDTGVADALMKVAEQGSVDRGYSIFGGCDILALATHGRSGVQRWVLGSVTERVLGHTKLPLLIVRPQQEQLKLASATSEPVEREAEVR